MGKSVELAHNNKGELGCPILHFFATYQPILTAATNLATITAVIFAGIGLFFWRRQLKITTDNNLAKSLLKSVYILRDAVKRVREKPKLDEKQWAIEQKTQDNGPSFPDYGSNSFPAVN
jgi:hypothetical protein